jgi:hypothetical protein
MTFYTDKIFSVNSSKRKIFVPKQHLRKQVESQKNGEIESFE